MRTKLVFGSLFACAIMIACSSSDSTSPGIDDNADAGNDPTNTKKDSGSTSPNKDSGSTNNDASSNSGTAKVGDSCTSDAQCSGAVASKCSNTLSTDGSLFPTPFCVGACTGDLKECDGPKTICDDITGTGGVCLLRCTASTTAITTACPAKMGCSLLNADGSGVAVGECIAACKVDADCATGEKCQVETGNCLTEASAGKGVGEACTTDDECAASCISPTGKSGYCTRTCTVGGTDCPTGFVCNVGISQADFDGNPTGAVGACFKTCAAVDECAAAADTAAWECATLGGGDKACVLAAP